MKTITKNLLITIVALLVFGLVTGQLNRVDDWLVAKQQQNKEAIVFNAPISTFNLGK